MEIDQVAIGERHWRVKYAYINNANNFEFRLNDEGSLSFEEILWKQDYPYRIDLLGKDGETLNGKVEIIQWVLFPDGPKLNVSGVVSTEESDAYGNTPMKVVIGPGGDSEVIK